MRLMALALGAVAVLAAGCGDQKSSAPAAGSAPAPSGQAGGIWAAGSSTVFPFATRVAENFARKNGGAAPRVESLGTGGGIKAFCQGAASGSPDIANASRPMKASEFEDCQKNGVGEIIEVKIGYDGIVIANARAAATYDFKLRDLYMGLANEVPQGAGFVQNPYKTWREVSATLPADRIQTYGPPPTSGTRDAFLELAIVPGAEEVPAVKALKDADEKRFETISERLREDGAWIDSGENDNAIVQTLTRTPGSLGVFGYSFLEQNGDQVKGAKINGVAPTLSTIADGSYPLSRSLYIYVKKSRLATTPGLKGFVEEFLSETAAGRGGYLQDRGLIPLPEAQLVAQRQAFAAGAAMTKPEN